MFFIEPSLFCIPVLFDPSLFFITVSVGALKEGPGPCQRLACRSPSLASKWSPAMWGHARGVNFDAQVAAWREAYGSKADAAALDSSSSRRLLLIECWLHVCTLPWPHQTADSEQLWSILLLYMYAGSGAECTYCRWHDSSSQLGGIGKSWSHFVGQLWNARAMDTMSIYDPGLPQRATYKAMLRMSVRMPCIDVLEARKNSMHIHVIARSGLMKS